MTAASPSVLIAEQHDLTREFLADNLQADGYRPICANDTVTALEMLCGALDALIVDMNGDTIGLVDAIRDERCPVVDPQLPILVLTSEAGELHRTRLLERGAYDVLSKPFSYTEFRARLGALLRRAHARRAPRLLRAGSLRLDASSRRVWVSGVEIEALPGKEYALLLALIGEPERVFTREELLRSSGASAARREPGRSTPTRRDSGPACRSAAVGSSTACGVSVPQKGKAQGGGCRLAARRIRAAPISPTEQSYRPRRACRGIASKWCRAFERRGFSDGRSRGGSERRDGGHAGDQCRRSSSQAWICSRWRSLSVRWPSSSVSSACTPGIWPASHSPWANGTKRSWRPW